MNGILAASAPLDLTEQRSTEIVPRYLMEHDHPWLRSLLDEYERHVGKRRAELQASLTEPPIATYPKAKLALALRVIDRIATTTVQSSIAPARAREVVFVRRARAPAGEGRRDVLIDAAGELGVTPSEVEESLFGDLPGERRVVSLGALSPAALAQAANGELVSGWLRRATSVTLLAHGNVRALVRHAHITGLICSVALLEGARGGGRARGVRIEVSGPLALFRRTTVYGRALASLVPRLAWCEHFELRAECLCATGKSGAGTLLVRSGDPILPARELPRYDSKLEERFAKDFGKLARSWRVVREPLPVDVGGKLIFPDFELLPASGVGRGWLLEIVGYWTREYLTKKLADLRAANIDRLIVCVDEARCCDEHELPKGARVIPFKRRIDAQKVLEIIESGAS